MGLSSGPNLWRYDLDGSGRVDDADETLFLNHFNPPDTVTVQPGGHFITSSIGARSLVLPTADTRATIQPGSGTIVLENLQFGWSYGSPATPPHQAVPEPSAIVLALIGLSSAAALGRKWLRRRRVASR
jgi:hypothetical protein